MLRRFELHNHTTESDASITCRELTDIMVRDRVDAFALTDHNTISGHRKVKALLQSGAYPIECIYGMEYTTYYGHILCLNLNRYVPWDSIDRHRPERLFQACQEAGAVTGIAHPFSFGDPFARGCRFEMTIHDFSFVEFIEVFNNSEPLHVVNEPGLNWWLSLVLRGERLAATAGMDLHGDRDMSMQFATYLEAEGTAADSLARSIRTQQTWVSKGMILRCEMQGPQMHFSLEDVRKPGYDARPPYYMTLTSSDGEVPFFIGPEGLWLPRRDAILIPRLYSGEVSLENLVCLSPPILPHA